MQGLNQDIYMLLISSPRKLGIINCIITTFLQTQQNQTHSHIPQTMQFTKNTKPYNQT